MQIKNVRIMFPSVFQKGTYEGKETKYECTFILDKTAHADEIAAIQADIQTRVDELKIKKLSDDRTCLKDGDDLEYESTQGAYTIKASSQKRPLVINRSREPITEEDGIIYGGCYVNAIVDLWTQNNGYGKRINCGLSGIQFVKDGEPFAGGGSSADDFDLMD